MDHSNQILQCLEKTDAVSVEKLAERLHISERSIRNAVLLLRKDASRNGFAIHTIRSKGYCLHINDVNAYRKYRKTLQTIDFADKSERINKIMELIFMRHDGYITIDEISSVLGVSRRTILNDLKDVRKELIPYSLAITSKSHYGIKVSGDEIKIRTAISDLLNKNSGKDGNTIEYFEFAERIDKKQLKKKYEEIIQKHKLSINDSSINAVALHTIIMIYRIKQNNTIQEVHINHQMINKEYFKVATEMMAYIQEQYAVTVQQQEIELMASQLFGKCEYIDPKMGENNELKESIVTTLKAMDSEYATDFAKDNLLIEGLLLHIYPLRLRAASGLELNNSLVNSVSAQYMNAFIMSMRFIEKNRILNQYSFSRDEIGYIAFHFATHEERNMQLTLESVRKIALIIDSVRSDVSLLKLKIKQVFPNAEIKVAESSTITPDSLAEADLALTTIQKTNGILKTAIYIPSVVDEHVQWNLRNQAIYYMKTKTETMPELTGLFNEDLFFIEEKKMPYQQILKKYSTRIYQLGYATKEYPDSVLERENKFSTVYDNGIAAPHGLRETSLKDCIAVILLKKPIEDQGKRCQCIFMINVSEKHLFIYQEIGDFLIKLITNDQISKEVSRSRTFEEFKLYAKQTM